MDTPGHTAMFETAASDGSAQLIPSIAVVLPHRPLFLAGVSIGTERGHQQINGASVRLVLSFLCGVDDLPEIGRMADKVRCLTHSLPYPLTASGRRRRHREMQWKAVEERGKAVPGDEDTRKGSAWW